MLVIGGLPATAGYSGLATTGGADHPGVEGELTHHVLVEEPGQLAHHLVVVGERTPVELTDGTAERGPPTDRGRRDCRPPRSAEPPQREGDRIVARTGLGPGHAGLVGLRPVPLLIQTA
ncbi:hypothetical protein [Kitasatospora sp. GAS204B]|uniref:hypothetical protein n=1 Tax=unclassified Kitasatospora TaxID=2633591 RepID=UPI002474AA9E|nr:hypothetical protein [Kitasatospora sp. GAS204B]MDH6122900.1 hypothetical protein [Kitasatospora sp. GAS204B]